MKARSNRNNQWLQFCGQRSQKICSQSMDKGNITYIMAGRCWVIDVFYYKLLSHLFFTSRFSAHQSDASILCVFREPGPQQRLQFPQTSSIHTRKQDPPDRWSSFSDPPGIFMLFYQPIILSSYFPSALCCTLAVLYKHTQLHTPHAVLVSSRLLTLFSIRLTHRWPRSQD